MAVALPRDGCGGPPAVWRPFVLWQRAANGVGESRTALRDRVLLPLGRRRLACEPTTDGAQRRMRVATGEAAKPPADTRPLSRSRSGLKPSPNRKGGAAVQRPNPRCTIDPCVSVDMMPRWDGARAWELGATLCRGERCRTRLRVFPNVFQDILGNLCLARPSDDCSLKLPDYCGV